ncbi:MAG TPA: FTR1 family protein, partial [Candidatus Saccharimonadia bacterium]|nr:FTR1 family protein [Candidatus Saccharimonadia bacterium]
EIATQVAAIGQSLDEVERALGAPGSRTATALSAFLILFREGLEAILVVAAVLALVLRSGQREAVRYVHLGWAGALVAGALTWFAARALVDVSGAAREVTEGVSALLASAILLYVGFWLHGKSHAQAWNAFISRHLKGAMTSRAVWALAGVSFLAVYHEAFETVLFYETLWAQEGEAGGGSIVLGFAAALVALLVVGVAIFRYGMRLPIGPFFAISALLMAILAVVFAGQGIAALQEAGVVDASVVAFPRIEWLGIHPTAQTLAAQAVALAVVVAIYARPWLSRRLARPVA